MTDKKAIQKNKTKTYSQTHCSHYVLGECSQEHNDNCPGTDKCIKALEQDLQNKQQECEELVKQYKNLCKYQLEEKSRIEQDHVNFIDEINRYKQVLDEIEEIINSLHYQTLIFHSGNTHVLADKIQETKNQIQGIINTAKEVNNAG